SPAACARTKASDSFMRRRISPNSALLPEPGSPVTQTPHGAPSFTMERQRLVRRSMTVCLPTKSRANVLLVYSGRDCDIVGPHRTADFIASSWRLDKSGSFVAKLQQARRSRRIRNGAEPLEC